MVHYAKENSGYAISSGSGAYSGSVSNYAVVSYSNNSSVAEQLSFLCRGTCGTEMGCTCGRRKRS